MSGHEKPVAEQIVTAIRWNKAVEYVESITGREIRDWEGKYRGDGESKPYHDFWHWIVAKLDPRNGGVIAIHAEFRDLCNGQWAWAQEVLDIFLREFGEGAKFWIEW